MTNDTINRLENEIHNACANIERLKRETNKAQEKLEKLEGALKICKEIFGDDDGDNHPTTPASQPKPHHYNLTESVIEIVKKIGDHEFLVQDIEEELPKYLHKVPRNPRTRIAMVLKTLIPKGLVTCTYVGAGCIPNHYRSASSANDFVNSHDWSQKSSSNH